MKTLFLLLALFSLPVIAADPVTLLSNKTATTTITQCPPIAGGKMTFAANGTTTAGSGSATVIVQGTHNQNNGWVTLGTITLTLGTTVVADGFVTDAPWTLVCGYVSAISGIGASVSLTAGR